MGFVQQNDLIHLFIIAVRFSSSAKAMIASFGDALGEAYGIV